ncbi:MAG: B12-binding domain-containing radical SAM protein [Myxococcales bacterium]|nr:B12-binding domain-containing radical SAM protein [Myxococcales bacterium]
MKVVLISPKGPLYRYRGGIFRKSLRFAPLTLPTLASLVPLDLNAEILLVDEGIEEVPLDLEADLIGMTVITGSAPRAYELSAHFRSRGIPVVLGGPHPTLVPDDAAPHADAVVTGYAEDTWPQLLRDFAAGQMKARYDQAPDLSLADRPLPRRDLVRSRHYTTTAVFEATRGCVHACDFCVVPSAWGRTQLQKPVADVVREIRSQNTRKALFVDLNLIADRRYARELFDALTPLRLRWFGLATTLLTHDADLLDRMVRSGCRGLLIGFETLSTEGLAGVHKGFNDPDAYASLVHTLHRRGVAVQGTFVFGLDNEGTDVFERTVDFCVQSGIDLPRFSIQTPFPGTPLFRKLDHADRILTRDWALYDGQHVVYRPDRMTARELVEGHEWAWRQVYSLPNIARRLARSRQMLPISIPANLGYRYYARHLHTHYTCDSLASFGPASAAS